MKIIHRIGNKERSGEGSGKFLLTNKKGSYLSFGKPESDHDGWFVYDAKTRNLFKILQSISLSQEADTIINGLSWVERKTKEVTEKFYLTSNALVYEISNYTGPVFIDLDCKRLYDDSTEKRIYSSEHEKIETENSLHVHYTKYSGLMPQYTRHLFITTQANIRKKHFWHPKKMPYDVKRGSQDERWIYNACEIDVENTARIIFTNSQDSEKARKKAEYIIENEEDILYANENYPNRFDSTDFERAVVVSSIDSLITKLKEKKKGMFAGLPWFFQFWMRDEAIALGAIIKLEYYSLAKEIIFRQLSEIKKGTAHEDSNLGSADGPGILAKRTYELLQKLKKQKKLDDFFSKNELETILNSFTNYYDSLPFENGFVKNSSKETWMDTEPFGDSRDGFRIEIQLLTIQIILLFDFLKKTLRKSSKEFQTSIKEKFFVKGKLLDGFYSDGRPDTRARPNIFLAWYYYPELLSQKEWEQSFDAVLPELWLEWGGLASISIHDELFQNFYTGMNGSSEKNASYHHGDSWYFINNIVAMALYSINPDKYQEKIESILAASRKDLFFQGFIGHSSEVSSAAKQEPGGCFSQLWSITTFYELLELLRVN